MILNEMLVIIINSAIGGGKSELIDKCEKLEKIHNMKVVIVKEDLSLITNINGINTLQLFYSHMKRWSFTFQFFMFILRLLSIESAIEENGDNCIYIIERCWFADYKCFASTLHGNGYMTEMEWFTYNKIFNRLVKTAPKIDGYIFIECSLETHMKRIKERGREEEVDITETYENELIKRHKDLRDETDIPYVIIDGELNFKNNEDDSMNVLGQITDFVETLLK